eukprot:2277561-Prymnesium_polylepis.1
MLRSIALLACFSSVAAHGALISPPSRNALDRFLPGFQGGASKSDSCNCGSNSGCEEGVRASGGGQPCLWFSQGCTIGCDECTGLGSHTAQRLCNGTMQPTLPKYAWTMNRWASEGSVNDSYRYNPWRAPGAAPVFDACGKAGGTYPKNFGPGVAVFANTTFAKGGDLGSVALPPAPSGTIWTAGSEAEVAWEIRYNHGGGYQARAYRLRASPAPHCRRPPPHARTPRRGHHAVSPLPGLGGALGGVLPAHAAAVRPRQARATVPQRHAAIDSRHVCRRRHFARRVDMGDEPDPAHRFRLERLRPAGGVPRLRRGAGRRAPRRAGRGAWAGLPAV